MNCFNVIADKAKVFQEGLQNGTYVSSIVKDNEDTIVNWNTESQLYDQGVNRYGVSISSYQPYAQSTIKYKQKRGQPYDRVTLRDEGDFHKSFLVETSSDSFTIKATDFKAQWLDKRYTPYIYGLTDAHAETLAQEIIKPKLLDIFRQTL